MPRFNFNEITREGKADINKIGENFEKIETHALRIDDFVVLRGTVVMEGRTNQNY